MPASRDKKNTHSLPKLTRKHINSHIKNNVHHDAANIHGHYAGVERNMHSNTIYRNAISGGQHRLRMRPSVWAELHHHADLIGVPASQLLSTALECHMSNTALMTPSIIRHNIILREAGHQAPDVPLLEIGVLLDADHRVWVSQDVTLQANMKGVLLRSIYRTACSDVYDLLNAWYVHVTAILNKPIVNTEERVQVKTYIDADVLRAFKVKCRNSNISESNAITMLSMTMDANATEILTDRDTTNCIQYNNIRLSPIVHAMLKHDAKMNGTTVSHLIETRVAAFTRSNQHLPIATLR